VLRSCFTWHLQLDGPPSWFFFSRPCFGGLVHFCYNKCALVGLFCTCQCSWHIFLDCFTFFQEFLFLGRMSTLGEENKPTPARVGDLPEVSDG